MTDVQYWPRGPGGVGVGVVGGSNEQWHSLFEGMQPGVQSAANERGGTLLTTSDDSY